ncbi:MAG: 2,3-bisphosphoglycerate-independent phosphoglycerate mutase [Oscillospiraceae bacterium]|jgi:2,3-bisphosphoglycerate-independent phosphoglycerate mutase|nr:2,3-bisphosphoglycerate-independent phosphoglycerate mutase [Oscillospiraceae bacterium]
MKYVLIIGDGMADNPVPELGGVTPLEYAKTPAMDALADAGLFGNVKNCPDGLPPGSDTAILSIFGCDPRDCYTGRAPLEAAATGIALVPGDIAYRCNMVTFEDSDADWTDKKILSHSAGSIEGEQSEEIVKALFADATFSAAAAKAGMVVYPAQSFRHIAVQSGASIDGVKLSPPHDHLGEKIGAILPANKDGSANPNAETLKSLMKLAHEVLNHHPLNEARRAAGKMPANGIWFWAEGTAVKLPNFVETYGKTGGVISAVPLCHGIANLVGLDRVYVEGATGELDTNYDGKVKAAMQVLKSHPFVAVHVEAPDECTHNGDTPGKLEAIQRLDSLVVGPIIERLRLTREDFRVLILSDHKTLTSTRGHDGTPVPFVIYDSRRDRKNGYTYREIDGEKGLTVAAGIELMGLLFGED